MAFHLRILFAYFWLMKKATLYLSVPLFWFLTNASSCKDRTDFPCDCQSYNDISEEMKAFINFKKGDYWVYRLKQDTTVIDTMFCDRLERRENNCGHLIENPNANACSYFYTLVLIHSNSDSFPHVNQKPNQKGAEVITTGRSGSYDFFSLAMENANSGSGNNHIFDLPYILNVKRFKVSDYKIISDNINLELHGNNFQKSILIKFDPYYKWAGRNFMDSIYLSPGKGIVKYNLDTTGTQTWELIKYKL